MSDTYIDRLSDYLDDELPPAERADVESHLAQCRDCSVALAELRAVVARAAVLQPRPPSVDLWPGIEPRLSASEQDRHVIAFRAPASRRFSFTLPQIAAAGIALMVMSGGGVWLLQNGGRATSMPPVVATDPARNPVVPAALTDAPASFADPRYDEAIADLEEALKAGRGDLDPTTVKILEANLAAIDKAIAESRAALDGDPANVYLNGHLADARQRKLALLRRAASLVGGKS